jgi:hypothetical protein
MRRSWWTPSSVDRPSGEDSRLTSPAKLNQITAKVDHVTATSAAVGRT